MLLWWWCRVGTELVLKRFQPNILLAIVPLQRKAREQAVHCPPTLQGPACSRAGGSPILTPQRCGVCRQI